MTTTFCHAVEMVGRAPSLMALTYASVSPSNIGPSRVVPLTFFSPTLMSTCCFSRVTPSRNPGASCARSGRALSASGLRFVPRVGCASVTHERLRKSSVRAVRVSFCSFTAAEAPSLGLRHSSRYCCSLIGRPASSTSSSWKSRSSQMNCGKNCESAPSSSAPSACTRIFLMSCTTSDSWSSAPELMAFSELYTKMEERRIAKQKIFASCPSVWLMDERPSVSRSSRF
mmetsp:Transcript_22730/g.56493  ORF Transcript_22730/g.56493 Transcript_22730/m.56493 type:complete len:228 (+) Transcript_22730:580-1263(+)